MITETEALKSLDISDFRHPTKDTMIKMVSMLDQMDPEVAEKILEQFPEFASTARGILTEYKELLDEGLKSNNESIKNVYDTYNTIIVSLRKELENEDLTFEQKKYIIEQMKEIAGIIYKKDTENKKFITKLFKITAAVVVSAVFAVASPLGGNTQIGTDDRGRRV